MVDVFEYTAPYRVWGRLAEVALLNAILTCSLRGRAALIKAVAESDEWKRYAPP